MRFFLAEFFFLRKGSVKVNTFPDLEKKQDPKILNRVKKLFYFSNRHDPNKQIYKVEIVTI